MSIEVDYDRDIDIRTKFPRQVAVLYQHPSKEFVAIDSTTQAIPTWALPAETVAKTRESEALMLAQLIDSNSDHSVDYAITIGHDLRRVLYIMKRRKRKNDELSNGYTWTDFSVNSLRKQIESSDGSDEQVVKLSRTAILLGLIRSENEDDRQRGARSFFFEDPGAYCPRTPSFLENADMH